MGRSESIESWQTQWLGWQGVKRALFASDHHSVSLHSNNTHASHTAPLLLTGDPRHVLGWALQQPQPDGFPVLPQRCHEVGGLAGGAGGRGAEHVGEEGELVGEGCVAEGHGLVVEEEGAERRGEEERLGWGDGGGVVVGESGREYKEVQCGWGWMGGDGRSRKGRAS